MFIKAIEVAISSVLFVLGAVLACPTVENPGPSEESAPTGSEDYPTVDAECGSTIASLKKYLLDAGYDQNAVAGILGNLMQESGSKISLTSVGGGATITSSFVAYDLSKTGEAGKNFTGGFGIAQWDYWGRVKKLQQYANAHAGGKVVSEKAQFGYLVEELSADYSPARLNNRSLEDIAWVVRRSYENPYSVRCTKSAPCTSYSFTCESGYPCRYTGNVKNGKKEIAYWNSVNTNKEKTPYDTIVNNKLDYWAAWLTLEATIKHAKTAKSISIANCYGSEYSQETGEGSPTPEEQPSTPTDPRIPTSTEEPEIPTAIATTGALGATSSNGFYRQDQYKSTVWRKDNSTINDSGCSLISVANSMKVLGLSGSDPKTLANQTKNVISGEKQTGWGGSSMSIDWLLNKNGMSHTYIWTSYGTSTDKKIQAIRAALASGKAIIAGGDRKHVNSSLTTCPSTSSGDCVFSYKGHFVAIVGITASDKLVIANPARGNGSGNVFDAATVLKYSNKAIAVGKK